MLLAVVNKIGDGLKFVLTLLLNMMVRMLLILTVVLPLLLLVYGVYLFFVSQLFEVLIIVTIALMLVVINLIVNM